VLQAQEAFLKLIHWFVTAPLALLLIIFAVSNRDAATVTLWPLPLAIDAPLYLIVLLSLLVGFLAGELVAWFNGRRWRREARFRARRIEALERELAARQTITTPSPTATHD
jgi:lipopolysaccharide assembly protein A